MMQYFITFIAVVTLTISWILKNRKYKNTSSYRTGKNSKDATLAIYSL